MSSQKYLLPCSCGRQHKVDATQAGLTVSCECGKELEVPTMLGLRKLKRAEAPQEERPSWGVNQGLMFVGGLVALAGLVVVLRFAMDAPRRPDAESVAEDYGEATPSQLWLEWLLLEEGPEPPEGSPLAAYVRSEAVRYYEAAKFRRRVLVISGLATAVGLGLLATGYFRERAAAAKRRPRRR